MHEGMSGAMDFQDPGEERKRLFLAECSVSLLDQSAKDFLLEVEKQFTIHKVGQPHDQIVGFIFSQLLPDFSAEINENEVTEIMIKKGLTEENSINQIINAKKLNFLMIVLAHSPQMHQVLSRALKQSSQVKEVQLIISWIQLYCEGHLDFNFQAINLNHVIAEVIAHHLTAPYQSLDVVCPEQTLKIFVELIQIPSRKALEFLYSVYLGLFVSSQNCSEPPDKLVEQFLQVYNTLKVEEVLPGYASCLKLAFLKNVVEECAGFLGPDIQDEQLLRMVHKEIRELTHYLKSYIREEKVQLYPISSVRATLSTLCIA